MEFPDKDTRQAAGALIELSKGSTAEKVQKKAVIPRDRLLAKVM